MKVHVLLACLLSLLLPLPLQAQARPTAQVRVIVTLREQADLGTIQAGGATQRCQQIVTLLKATAAQSAQGKANAVAMRAVAGEPVSDITPFWIFNGFAITASPSVIARLAAPPRSCVSRRMSSTLHRPVRSVRPVQLARRLVSRRTWPLSRPPASGILAGVGKGSLLGASTRELMFLIRPGVQLARRRQQLV